MLLGLFVEVVLIIVWYSLFGRIIKYGGNVDMDRIDFIYLMGEVVNFV